MDNNNTDNRPPHRSSSNNTTGNNNTSELFICFTSRLSSSSMKISSSKSILSPGRARDSLSSSHQLSLSSSSRRLKNSGSLKGGQGLASPMMFPSIGKKRGCAFENPEPSSPKVTCIGQVRVKTKKQSKKMRIRSKREVMSFRSNSSSTTLRRSHSIQQQQQQQQPECLPHRNQRWVHLPMTICEALRAVGSEFNCFLPCRSSCMSSTGSEKDGKSGGRSGGHETSCGAVLARWLMSLHEGDVKGRDIEFVVGEEEEEDEEEEEEEELDVKSNGSSRRRRRHVFENIELDDKFEEWKEKEAKVNICVPPKNALLLMRCRSDPVKLEALASRFCESNVAKDREEENEANVKTGKETRLKSELVKPEVEDKEVPDAVKCEEAEAALQVVKANAEEKLEEKQEIDDQAEASTQGVGGSAEDNKLEERHEIEEAVAVTQGVEANAKETLEEWHEIDEAKGATQVVDGYAEEKLEERHEIDEQADVVSQGVEASAEEKLEERHGIDEEVVEQTTLVSSSEGTQLCDEAENLSSHEIEKQEINFTQQSSEENETESLTQELFLQEDDEEEEEDSEPSLCASFLASLLHSDSEEDKEHHEEQNQEQKEVEAIAPADSDKFLEHEPDPNPEVKPVQQSEGLPECLMLMMREPKLSMEVPRETWVCSTDFIRRLPGRQVTENTKSNGSDEQEQPKNRLSIDSIPSKPSAQQLHQPPRSSCHYPSSVSAGLGAEQKLVGCSKAYEPFVLTRCKSEPMRNSAKLEPHGVGAARVGF